MRYVPILVLFAVVPALHAGLGQGNIACRAGREDNRPYKKKLWDGYEISLGPVPNALDYGCTAAIYNSAGKVVFRTTGFDVVFDEELTAEDFDGDGKPKVVFQTNMAGGAHCCWTYNVVSLSPKPRHLFDVGAGAAVRFEKDKQGKMVIWERTPGPSGYWDAANDRPYADRVFRVREGKLVDSTPEFCSRMFAPGRRTMSSRSWCSRRKSSSNCLGASKSRTIKLRVRCFHGHYNMFSAGNSTRH